MTIDDVVINECGVAGCKSMADISLCLDVSQIGSVDRPDIETVSTQESNPF